MRIEDFEKGKSYDNKTLVDTFMCSSQGGMRRSKKTGTLVLISKSHNNSGVINENNPYVDKWDGDVFNYTGMGRTGDQSFFSRQNKTVYQSPDNGVEMHLFESFKPNSYTYRGVVKCEKSYVGQQPDIHGKMRKVCIFDLRVK